MKLKNKKTGEIAELGYIANSDGWIILQDANTEEFIAKYNSLAELNAEWEDAPEEPKGYYYINTHLHSVDYVDNTYENKGKDQEIGNYFKTKEEAEKAVEKLKAWKRLKDFGCGFVLDDLFYVKFVVPDAIKITSAEEQKLLRDDYKLLFRGEE